MMNNFEKVVYLGDQPETRGAGRQIPAKVFCKIAYSDGRLSITGVVGPMKSGNCLGSCGQIHGSIDVDRIQASENWDPEKIRRFLGLWEAWHLNDMTAGSPNQELYLKTLKDEGVTCPGYPISHYDWASEQLANKGLNPDPEYLHNGEPYKYGSAWLKVDVPESVLGWLSALPESELTPEWV